jgi:hypothetical protein
MRMRLKGCRRCGGDLMPDKSDRDGLTMSCLQCGQEMRFKPGSRTFSLASTLRPVPVVTSPHLGVRAA